MSGRSRSYAELEIGLFRTAGVCRVELRYTDPGSEAEIPPLRDETSLDPDELLPYQLDAEEYGKILAEVDYDAEVVRGRAALEGASVAVAGRPLTLDRLADRLREADGHGVDVLYLVCHGALSRRRQEPILYLQRADGTTDAVHGDRLAERLQVVCRRLWDAMPADDLSIDAT